MASDSASTSTPQQLLALEASARASLADRLVTPWWYYPALGLLFGCLTASIAIESPYTLGVSFALFVVGLSVLASQYRSETGIGRIENPRGRPLLIGLTGMLLCVGVVVGTAATVGGATGTIVAAVVAFLLVVGLGPRFDAVVRNDLRDEQ